MFLQVFVCPQGGVRGEGGMYGKEGVCGKGGVQGEGVCVAGRGRAWQGGGGRACRRDGH